MYDIASPGLFLVKYLGATTTEDKKVCLQLAKECPDEVRRIAAALGLTMRPKQ